MLYACSYPENADHVLTRLSEEPDLLSTKCKDAFTFLTHCNAGSDAFEFDVVVINGRVHAGSSVKDQIQIDDGDVVNELNLWGCLRIKHTKTPVVAIVSLGETFKKMDRIQDPALDMKYRMDTSPEQVDESIIFTLEKFFPKRFTRRDSCGS